jgi:hypothetical protein
MVNGSSAEGIRCRRQGYCSDVPPAHSSPPHYITPECDLQIGSARGEALDVTTLNLNIYRGIVISTSPLLGTRTQSRFISI